MALRLKHIALGVLFSALWLPQIVTAQPVVQTGKAYAVFVASYNLLNNEARGGVAGTAFFVGAQKAITAYHVLQARSFVPLKGFDRVRVWLVHEGEAPIELKSSDLRIHPDQDMTTIELSGLRKAPARYVFSIDRLQPLVFQVETEGFLVSSTGPILERRGKDIDVVEVPKLERMKLNGQILQNTQVSLNSSDVNLANAQMVQLSYQPIKGFSGGPVVSNGRVIGMNSFADPEGGRSTWALQLSKIN